MERRPATKWRQSRDFAEIDNDIRHHLKSLTRVVRSVEAMEGASPFVDSHSCSLSSIGRRSIAESASHAMKPCRRLENPRTQIILLELGLTALKFHLLLRLQPLTNELGGSLPRSPSSDDSSRSTGCSVASKDQPATFQDGDWLLVALCLRLFRRSLNLSELPPLHLRLPPGKLHCLVQHL